jgi:AsmA protein
MNKVLKYLLIAVAALVALLVAAVAIIAATFNPNDYKPELIKLVKEETGRTLSIPGEIQLTFFPRIGADLGQLSLSEPRSEQIFAAAKQARVSVALLPLFSKQVVVDRVLIDGLSVRLQRDRSGRYNFDDLLPRKEEGAGQPQAETPKPQAQAPASIPLLNIGGIAITHASLDYRDDASRRHLTVANLDLTTGPIADGKKSQIDFSADLRGENPTMNLKLGLKSGFTPELAQQRLLLDSFTASIDGAAAGLSDLRLKLSLPALEATGQTFKTPVLTLEVAFKQAGQAISTKVAGALQGDLTAQRFEFSKLGIEATAPNPAGGTLALKAQGKASADLAHEAVQVALDGQLDSTTLALKAGVHSFAQPAIDFDIALGELDADRYLPKSEKPTAAPNTPATGAKTGPEPVIDLSPLQALNLRGALKVAALKVMGLKATNIRLQLKALGGQVEVNPLAAALYGGGVNGSLTASAGKPQRLAAKLDLRSINIGPLMKDAIDQQPIDGRGNVAINLGTSGNTVSQFKQGLNGTAGLQLQDGAINGINIAAALRNAKAKLGAGSQEGAAAAQDKTDFTEFGASFKITNGVAHNDDLSAKTPLLRLGGAGDIFIGEDRLDYTVKATVGPTLQGQGGPELEQLKGLTIPVRLTGPYSAIAWKIDFGSLASNRAKELIEQRKAQVQQDVQQKLDEEKAKAGQRLKEQAEDALKNLLRR